MPLELTQPQQTIDDLVSFLQTTFTQQHKTQAVIAVSGGIDSALAVTLLTKALGAAQVTALSLPYGDQSVANAQAIIEFNQLPAANVRTINIKSLTDSAAQTLQLVPATDPLRFGNLKARARMLCVYDTAKKLEALVCGTENKSEHYLGYFTRFGDAASDLEPICQLYKTQVRQLAQFLNLPLEVISAEPSAGLWEGQTDEAEMGFTYAQADQVLWQLIDEKKSPPAITVPETDQPTVQKIINQVISMDFKLKVPYLPKEKGA